MSLALPVVISALALVVSAGTLWYTLSARARLHADVERHFDELGVPERDYLTIYNTGRAAAIILTVGARDGNGKLFTAAYHPDVAFPELPTSLPPQGVIRVTFDPLLLGTDAAIRHGYAFRFIRTRPFRRGVRDKMTVKLILE